MTSRLRQSVRKAAWLAALCGLMGAPHVASADWIQTFNVDPAHNTNTNGNVIDGTAVFSFNATTGRLTVTVTNNIVNPRADNQNISALFFKASTGQTAGSLSSSSAVQMNVNSDKSYTLLNSGNPVSTSWSLATNQTVANPVTGSITGNYRLTSLGLSHAVQTIIGAPDSSTNTYLNANPSITNGVHNPFLFETATFVLSGTGLTDASRISSLTWGVGTTTGNYVNGHLVTVPEPATLALVGIGLAGIAALRFRRRAAA
jgi:hypothetical protein